MTKPSKIDELALSAWLDGEWDGDEAEMHAYLRDNPEAQNLLDGWRDQGSALKCMVSDLADPAETSDMVIAVRQRIEERQSEPLTKLSQLFGVQPKLLWGLAFVLLLGILSAPFFVYLWGNFIEGSMVREGTTTVKGEQVIEPEQKPVRFEEGSSEKP